MQGVGLGATSGALLHLPSPITSRINNPSFCFQNRWQNFPYRHSISPVSTLLPAQFSARTANGQLTVRAAASGEFIGISFRWILPNALLMLLKSKIKLKLFLLLSLKVAKFSMTERGNPCLFGLWRVECVALVLFDDLQSQDLRVILKHSNLLRALRWFFAESFSAKLVRVKIISCNFIDGGLKLERGNFLVSNDLRYVNTWKHMRSRISGMARTEDIDTYL